MVIVIVPMISVALVLFRLISDSQNGQADAGLRARVELAHNLYLREVRRADRVLRAIVRDPGLAGALNANRAPVVHRRLTRLAAADGATRVLLTGGPAGTIDVGHADGVAPATQNLLGQGNRSLGRLSVAVTTAGRLAGQVRQATGIDAAVAQGHRLNSTLALPGFVVLPALGHLRDGGVDYRVASFDAPGFGGSERVSVLSDLSETRVQADNRRLLAGLILGGFLLVAFGFALLVSRSLQREIGAFLEAARRLGRGDFSAQVPVTGNDEFAALGGEFNKMSTQLEARLEELRQQRQRLERALRRVGETFASNLDRDALLEIVLRTAVDGVGANAGRVTALSEEQGELEERAAINAEGALVSLLVDTARAVAESGEPVSREKGGTWALGHPLLAGPREGADGDERPRVAGTVVVARGDRAFDQAERDLFHYLAAQAAVSIENVDLHETVQRQAVTDELTGLFNHRRFQAALEGEAERTKRFEQEMGLVMLDIDNFKRVNDTYGHQQGDLVLREVARVLRSASREIDYPARYGGEELAVVLPQTDLEGAYNLAERVRQGVEELELPLLEGEGTMSVTASLGVAALPTSAEEPRDLVAAADGALYEAKRSGKNKVVRAQ